MTDIDRPSFPMVFSDFEPAHTGLTIREHAAITLRVPDSGDPEIDRMIREARRADFARAALAGMTSVQIDLGRCDGEDDFKAKVAQNVRGTCSLAYEYADALLAEMEKGR